VFLFNTAEIIFKNTILGAGGVTQAVDSLHEALSEFTLQSYFKMK
jgi:hypothetical protein